MRNNSPEELTHHMFATYRNVRHGMAALAVVFPVLLVVVGWWDGRGKIR